MTEDKLMAQAPRNVGQIERGISIMAGSTLIVFGLKQRSWKGAGLALIGTGLVARGLTGQCAGYSALGINTATDHTPAQIPYRQGIRIDKAVTVNKPRFEVYQFWRNLENLPTFMKHLEEVRLLSDTISHWKSNGPLGRSMEWDAEIINDVPGELIAWRSLPGGHIGNAGSVHFTDAAGGRGAVVKVELQYLPPGGPVGALLTKWLGEDPSQQVESDLRRFKMMLETGEIPAKLDGQRKSEADKAEQRASDATVLQASEESFPASDAPAWR